MLNHEAGWRGSQTLATMLAIVSSIFFAVLFWVWERELLWMLAVVLPPIWSPVIYRRFGDDNDQKANRLPVWSLLVGLAFVLLIGLFVYLAA